MRMLEDAIIGAMSAHRGQSDKAGEPYILHPFRVMLSQQTTEERVVALLHDVLEDSEMSLTTLSEMFNPDIAAYVLELTKQKDEPYESYIDRLCKSSLLVRRIKMADLGDNLDPNRLKRLPEHLQTLLRMKYEPALRRLRATLTPDELR